MTHTPQGNLRPVYFVAYLSSALFERKLALSQPLLFKAEILFSLGTVIWQVEQHIR